MEDAAQRWNERVRRRLDELERLRPGRGPGSSSFWDDRAARFAARRHEADADEPLLAPLREAVRPTDTVVDVGAGTGRFALALAPHVAEVIAVEPSESMLAQLRQAAEARGIANVRCEPRRWEEAAVDHADVVMCGYVLPLIDDVAPFVRRLDAAAERVAFIHLSGTLPDVLHAPFWQHLHGTPRAPAPTYLDARAVLTEQGLDPRVQVVEAPVRARFADLDEAVADFRENLMLSPDDAALDELPGLLASWLVDTGDGRLRPPFATLPVAIMSWRPGGPT